MHTLASSYEANVCMYVCIMIHEYHCALSGLAVVIFVLSILIPHRLAAT